MKLDHINISAPADLLVKVRDFYCNMLGLTEGFRPVMSRGGYWLYADGKAIIHLVESQEHYHNEKQGYFDHFALQATGLALVLAKLDAADVSYRLSYNAEIDLSQVFCHDPSGTRVEINFPGESV